jgi:hypothetical protein
VAGPRIPDVLVLGSEIEIAAEHEGLPRIGRLLEPAGETLVPGQLGLVEHRADCPAVGSVDRNNPDATAGRCHHPRFCQRLVVRDIGRQRRTERLAEVGDHVGDPDAAGDRDSVPLPLAMVSQLVAGSAELGDGRGCIRQLGLLHQQHVGPRPLQPLEDLLQPRFERVHVPGGDPHDES